MADFRRMIVVSCAAACLSACASEGAAPQPGLASVHVVCPHGEGTVTAPHGSSLTGAGHTVFCDRDGDVRLR
jgi:hypothetical protein